jgi:RimJ/RimL family protein N-acetyltransferase
MMSNVVLRELGEKHLAALFEHQLDPAANHMAAFGAKDPSDRGAFAEKWTKILGDGTITKRAILCDGEVMGCVMAFIAPWSEQLEVSYWLGRRFWGNGIATKALAELLRIVTVRPIYARAAKDNVASIRVLEKCGFEITGFDRCYATSRGEAVDEVILELRGTTSTPRGV